jgi:hypothetical protein
MVLEQSRAERTEKKMVLEQSRAERTEKKMVLEQSRAEQTISKNLPTPGVNRGYLWISTLNLDWKLDSKSN